MGLNEWLALIGALGGFEAIKWIVNFYVNRRTNARKEDATADSMEFNINSVNLGVTLSDTFFQPCDLLAFIFILHTIRCRMVGRTYRST